MKKLLTGIAVCALAWVHNAAAKEYAYIYIEGDKQTPFYVKLEGTMQPRLGKNYCIIPNMDAGISNIEILFQQNVYPAQKFTVKIPEGGNRGFVLQKVNDRQFALRDLQQDIYLLAGNKADDDRLPDVATGLPDFVNGDTKNTQVVANQTDESLPAFAPVKRKKKEPKNEETTTSEEPTTQQQATKPRERFIEGMELNSAAAEKSVAKENTKPKKATKSKYEQVGKRYKDGIVVTDAEYDELNDAAQAPSATADNVAASPKTDCTTAMSNEDFEVFAGKLLEKTDDDAKLKVLSKAKGKQCYTTEQVRIIANNMQTQSGRYLAVQILYPATSDQANFPKLESLFHTNYLKDKFKALLYPQPQ
ncbi:MAG: DUF4476 domain-containing protein [Edaphocola sp.]